MCRLCIFGGTTEGRELAEFCVEKQIMAHICVTSEYGFNLLPKSEFLHISAARLDVLQMKKMFEKNKISLVIDAAHPYAEEVRKNIFDACKACNIRRLRVVRKRDGSIKEGTYFENIRGVIDFLNDNDGNFLVTVGGKNIAEFSGVKNYSERCTVRVLDVPEIEKKCAEMGFKKIISGRGPYSVQKNIEHLRYAAAEFLVTKESGTEGGFCEKIEAARVCGVTPLIVKRPKEDGISIEKIKKILIAEIDDE